MYRGGGGKGVTGLGLSPKLYQFLKPSLNLFVCCAFDVIAGQEVLRCWRVRVNFLVGIASISLAPTGVENNFRGRCYDVSALGIVLHWPMIPQGGRCTIISG